MVVVDNKSLVYNVIVTFTHMNTNVHRWLLIVTTNYFSLLGERQGKTAMASVHGMRLCDDPHQIQKGPTDWKICHFQKHINK